MPYIKVGRENTGDIEVYYEDHGCGTPVVLTHGYPLSSVEWEKQVPMLLEAGHRVILHDRRGWGSSSRPSGGHDYDTFSADYHAIIEQLDLRNAVLVGHSTGTGDVTRYLGTYGSSRVSRAVLISPIPPFLLATDDDPEGLPGALIDRFLEAASTDRLAWLKDFLDNFYNMDIYGGTLVSDQAFQASFNVAVAGSPIAAVKCISTWTTDFRADVASFDVPVLVIQGDQDRVLPLEFTGERFPEMVRDVTLKVIDGGPHGVLWTHSDQVNEALSTFLS